MANLIVESDYLQVAGTSPRLRKRCALRRLTNPLFSVPQSIAIYGFNPEMRSHEECESPMLPR